MRGLDPRIHGERQRGKTYSPAFGSASWMPGSSPGMTVERHYVPRGDCRDVGSTRFFERLCPRMTWYPAQHPLNGSSPGMTGCAKWPRRCECQNVIPGSRLQEPVAWVERSETQHEAMGFATAQPILRRFAHSRASAEHAPLIPAQAGIQSQRKAEYLLWVPAFAGTSGRSAHAASPNAPRHGRARPGHLDPLRRSALPIGITGTRPVMTWRVSSRLRTMFSLCS